MFLIYPSIYLYNSKAADTDIHQAIRTVKYPKESCQQILNVQSTILCFIGCLHSMDVHYLFSYNEKQKMCLCCKELPGSDIKNPGWKTFVPREYINRLIQVISQNT